MGEGIHIIPLLQLELDHRVATEAELYAMNEFNIQAELTLEDSVLGLIKVEWAIEFVSIYKLNFDDDVISYSALRCWG